MCIRDSVLNCRNEIMREVEISKGTLNSCTVHPREAFKEAIRDSGAGVIFIHNHPSGHPAPSRAAVSYTHLRAHETPEHPACRLLLEKKKKLQYMMSFITPHYPKCSSALSLSNVPRTSLADLPAPSAYPQLPATSACSY